MAKKFNPMDYHVDPVLMEKNITEFMVAQKFSNCDAIADVENKIFTLLFGDLSIEVKCLGDSLESTTDGFTVYLMDTNMWIVTKDDDPHMSPPNGEFDGDFLPPPPKGIKVDLDYSSICNPAKYFLEYTCPDCGAPRGVRHVTKAQFDAVTGLISVGEAHEHCSWEVKHEYDEDSLFKLRPQSCCTQY